MVICRYFQQGCCRYGQNCRYEHVYSSKYTYQASSATTPNTVTDEQLVKQVQSDIQAVINGGQWILSCYSPYKEKACFPGLNDLSQEEARLIIYEAKANNTLDQALSYMNNLFKETRHKYEQLLHPSPPIIKVLQSLYKGEPVNSPFGSSNQGFGSQATSLFRSAAQNDPFQNNSSTIMPTNNSVFSRLGNQNTNAFGNAPKSIFAQASQNLFGPAQPSNVFQMQSQPQENTAAKSIFAQASQNTFGQQQSVFATNQQQNVFATSQQQQNIFAPSPTNQQQQNVFATNPQQNVFASNQQQSIYATNQQNPFGIPQQNQTGNVFQQNNQSNNADIFGITKSVFQEQPVDDINVYSKIEDLSQTDLDAFKSAEFTLGFVPVLPPPHSLCV